SSTQRSSRAASPASQTTRMQSLPVRIESPRDGASGRTSRPWMRCSLMRAIAVRSVSCGSAMTTLAVIQSRAQIRSRSISALLPDDLAADDVVAPGASLHARFEHERTPPEVDAAARMGGPLDDDARQRLQRALALAKGALARQLGRLSSLRPLAAADPVVAALACGESLFAPAQPRSRLLARRMRFVRFERARIGRLERMGRTQVAGSAGGAARLAHGDARLGQRLVAQQPARDRDLARLQQRG